MAELTLGDLFEKDPEAFMALYGCMVGIAQTLTGYGRFRDIPVSEIPRVKALFKLGSLESLRLETSAKDLSEPESGALPQHTAETEPHLRAAAGLMASPGAPAS